MAFWTTEKLRERLNVSRIIVDHCPDRVQCGAYELGMGPEYFVTADADGERQHIKLKLEEGEQLAIPPGQFALLISEESVEIPADTIAFISIKASVKFQGLVNISGFHVDPGFRGRLLFSVQNAGTKPILLQRKKPLFLIWFADLDRKTAFPYSGKRNGQMEITPEDVSQITGEVVSPFELKKELDELKMKVNWGIAIAVAIMAGVLFPYFRDNVLHSGSATQTKEHNCCDTSRNSDPTESKSSKAIEKKGSALPTQGSRTELLPADKNAGATAVPESSSAPSKT